MAASALVAPAGAAVPHLTVEGGQRVIGEAEVVGDLVVAGGEVEVAGVVRGFVYAVGARVKLGKTAVALKTITVEGGALEVAPGAILPKTIHLVGASLAAPELVLEPNKRGQHTLGETTIHLEPGAPDPARLALMKAVLPFERFAPPSELGLSALGGWHPGLGFVAEEQTEAPSELLVGGLLRLSFVSGSVRGAEQRSYRGPRGAARFTLVEVADASAAEALWAKLAALPAERVSLSVKSALGDGAHWFFRNDGRVCLLWQRGRWLFALESKLDGPEPTLSNEVQLSRQVLESLRRSLEDLPKATARTR